VRRKTQALLLRRWRIYWAQEVFAAVGERLVTVYHGAFGELVLGAAIRTLNRTCIDNV